MMSARLEKIKPVYFLFGDEEYLAEEELRRIKVEVFGEAGAGGGLNSLNYQAFNAADKQSPFDAEVVLEAARTMPAFAPVRLVVVKGAEALKAAALDILYPYVKDPSPSTCLVFLSSGWKVNKNTKFFKALKQSNAVTQYFRLKGSALKERIGEYARGEGKKITPEAARRLISLTGPQLGSVLGELEKVVIFVGDSNAIELGDVEACAIDVKEETAFDLADAIGRQDAAKAFALLQKLEAEEPVKVLGAVAWQFRTLIKLKSELGTGSAGKLRIRPDKLRLYTGICNSMKWSELLGVIHSLRRADMNVKSGMVPKGLVLPKLIMELCI